MNSWHFAFSLVSCLVIVSADNRTFTITALPPAGSSIIQVSPASNYLEVLAGVPYSYSIITCATPFFGTSSSLVNAKLISSNATSCDASSTSLFGSPFDGATKPSQLTQLATRWGAFRYDFAGNFTVCMNVSSTFTLLPVSVVARGVSSTNLRMFCLYSNSTACTVYLQGNQMSGTGDARLALIAYGSGSCGSSALASPFASSLSSTIVSERTQEIHSLGLLSASTQISSYKACYCPGYQATGGSAGYVCTDLPANFVQGIGTLILIAPQVLDPILGVKAAIYPRATVDLQVLCGTGGCSTGDSPRIKIVDSNVINMKPYYDSNAGCRASLQSKRYLGQKNCDLTATNCTLTRSSPSSSSVVTFKGIKLDSELDNGIRVTRSFDVCFCDSGCSTRSNWFMIGTIRVLSLSVSFTQQGTVVPRVLVNSYGSLVISGTADGSFRTNGTLSREMKILADTYDSVIDPSACFNQLQSGSYVTGHDCYSASNCDVPVQSSRSGHIYGNDLIGIMQAGWAAVCYCNEGCRISESNWIVAGRLLVAGPKGDQSWMFPVSTSFNLSIDGFGMNSTDRMSIIPSSQDCQSAGPSGTFSNITGSVLSGTIIANLLDGHETILGGNGTVVDFGTSHGLVTGNRITLSGIFVGQTERDQMINKDHTVTVLSDSQVWINVQFGPGQFPALMDLSSSAWTRTSQLSFQGLMLNEGGTYTVCWISGSSSAVAGSLVVYASEL